VERLLTEEGCFVVDNGVGGGEKVRHFGGQKGASGVVTLWPTPGALQRDYAYDGLSSAGFTWGAR
jgi:hypothetical protein